MNRAYRHIGMVSIAAAAMSVAITVAPTLGQRAKTGKTAARSAAPSGGGLASLSDDALLTELAGRQMQGLLNHAFDVNQVPQAQRSAMLAIPAINRLGDPKVKPFERTQLIKQIADGADQVVAAINDPTKLMEHSTTLLEFGVNPEVNILEYWGDSPAPQKRLEPVIDTVIKMLDKAIKTGGEKRAKLEEQLNNGRNKKIEDEWTAIDKLVSTAEYTKAMVTYSQALAIPADAKGLEQRKKLVAPALEVLQTYDNNESGIQAAVRNRIAKLNMAIHDFGPGNDIFETVVSGKIDDKKKIVPDPGPFEQYEARYFSAVCELMQGQIDRAKQGVTDLVAWQQANVKEPEVQKQLDAAADMLRYRVAMKERDKAKDPAAKKAAEEQAFNILLGLNEKQPQLRPIIADQLISAMGENIDVKKADLLILQALLNRGKQAREAIDDPNHPDPELTKQVEQAVTAAREIMTRKDPKIVAQTVAYAAIEVPMLLQQIGRKVDAANAYMDYIEKKQGSPQNQRAAFERAGVLLSGLLKDGGEKNDPEIAKAWERFLPLAVNTFGRKDFAFDLATRLRAKQQLRDALKYFELVPKTDKRSGDAKFLKMVTLVDLIYAVGPDKKPLVKPDERPALVKQTHEAGGEVRKIEQDALKNAKDDKEKALHKSRIAVVTLTEAELAASGDKPDAALALKLLDGFEAQAAGLDNEAALNKRVMELRVSSYMQLKQFNKAAEMLLPLLEKEPGGRATGKVLGILQKLNEDYDRAKAAGNDEAARDILANRANLSGFLVKWAAESKDPNVNKNLYVYKLYDADTQRLFGSAMPDGQEKDAQLKKAMASFQALRQPNEVAAYKTLVMERKKDNPKDKTNPDDPDPGVTLGMALTSFELKDWKTASTELKRLRFAGKLGARARTDTDPKTGETVVVPNDQYWEAMYKYYESSRQWAATDPQNEDAQKELEAVKTLLRRDYVAGVDEVGGVKWREQFETLRKELIPDLNLDELRRSMSPAPATAPAETQPSTPVAARRD